MHSLKPILDGDWQHHELSDEEKETLAGWNRHDIVEANDAHFAGEATPVPVPINAGNTGDTDAFTADTGDDRVPVGMTGLTDADRERARQLGAGESDLDVNVQAAREAESQLASGPTPIEDEQDGVSEDEAEDAYDAMKNSELRDVCDQKSLPRTGRRPELLARLRQYDAEN